MKRERWLLLISILIFAGLGVYYLRPGWISYFAKKKLAPVPAKRESVPGGILGRTSDGVAKAKIKGEVLEQSTSWGRNPFLTEAEAAGGRGPVAEGIKVKAIVRGHGKSVATIDGRTVVVGEKVGEETVVEIREDSVVLDMNGTKRILRVSEPSIFIQDKQGKR